MCERNVKKKDSAYFEDSCDFRIRLTKKEYELMMVSNYPMSKFIEPIEEARCANGLQLFKRIHFEDDKMSEFEVCASRFSSRGKCNCGHKKLLSQRLL